MKQEAPTHTSAYQQRAPLASTLYDNKGQPVTALSKTPSRIYINKTPGGHQQAPPASTYHQRQPNASQTAYAFRPTSTYTSSSYIAR